MSFTIGKIIRTEQDTAGKWRIWCEVAEGEITMLKYNTNPTTAAVLADASKYITNQLLAATKQIAEANQKAIDIEKLSLVADMTVAVLKTKLGVISGVTK